MLLRFRLALTTQSQVSVVLELVDHGVGSGSNGKSHGGEKRVHLNRDTVLPRRLGGLL